jgi:hypothetical protein
MVAFVSIVSSLLVLLFLVHINSAAAADPWFNSAWSYRIKITINSLQVPSTQTNFPVYVNLGDLPAAFFSHVQSGGGDIRITASDGVTELPREVVAINTSSKTGELWFKAGSISDLAYFYVYYGDSGASEPSPSASDGSQSVWTNGYAAVYHMNQNPGGTAPQMVDSTGHSSATANGGMTSGNLVSGKIGSAISFNGSSNYLVTGNLTSYFPDSSLTIEAWVEPTNGGVAVDELGAGSLSAGWHDSQMEVLGSGAMYARVWNLTPVNTGTVTLSTWNYAVTRYSTTTSTLDGFLNGVVSGTVSTGSRQTPQANGYAQYYAIGPSDTTNAGDGTYYDGDIEEVRISYLARSNNWITSSYHNENSTTAFYTVGSESTPSTSGSNFQVMNSANYKMQFDSINFGGGASASASYGQQSTFGEVGTGNSSSANYALLAGYQQMETSYISISASSTAALADVNGLTGGASLASTTFTVLTDDPAGYSLSVQAASSPAMKGPNGATIADYVPASPPTPDYQFTITSSQAAFGFSAEGHDLVSKYKNNGTTCNTGTLQTANQCWDGFTTSPKIIAQSSSDNQPNGATTTLEYQVKIGTAKVQDNGAYSATITVTALTL